MSTPTEQILLIGGAGLPSWIWDDTRRALEGGRLATVAARPEVGMTARLRDYADAAAASAPAGRFAIVAHSSGGLIGAEVAEMLPRRVTSFLAVSAVVPRPRGSFLTSMPLAQRWALGLALRLAGTRPPDSAIRRGLAAGLDEQTTRRIIADFVPESPGLYRDRITGRSFGGARGYVHTLRDRELSIPLQRTFARRLDPSWSDELDTGHLPMLEAPRALADSIARFLSASS